MTATRVSSLYAVTRYGVQLHQVILCYRLQCSPMIPLKIAWRTHALFHELSLPLALVRCRCRAMVICGPTATAGSQRFFYNG